MRDACKKACNFDDRKVFQETLITIEIGEFGITGKLITSVPFII